MSHLERVIEYIIKFPSQYTNKKGVHYCSVWRMLWNTLWLIPGIPGLIVFCICVAAINLSIEEGLDVWKEYM